MSSQTEAADGGATPHCIHVIGIGRTGAVYVEALLRTGEVEDLLADPRARFAALIVDVGEADMGIARDYGASFARRLASRDIPIDRFHFQAICLTAPSPELMAGLVSSKAFLAEHPSSSYSDGELDAVTPEHASVGGDGAHLSRAVAKAVYAEAYYGGERVLAGAIESWAKHAASAELPSLVTICLGLAGGTGGGMAIDMARHAAAALGPDIRVIGVGQLPSSGDPEAVQTSASLYATLNDIDCMLDDSKNERLVSTWGEHYHSPFTGGFFVVNPEQSWQRLTAYTTTGEKAIRQGFKQTVTNRFVADSFMRLVVSSEGHDLMRAIAPTVKRDTGGSACNLTLFDVAKLTHPGVQVLPGEAPSKWAAVVKQWIEFTPQYSGLTDGFKTDYAEVFAYGSRNMGHDTMQALFKKMVTDTYLSGGNATVKVYMREFFDTLTAYANVILPGVGKTDLAAFWSSQKTYDALPAAAKLAEQSWLIDEGAKLPAATAALEPMAGQAVWGCSGWKAIPDAEMRGEAPAQAATELKAAS